MPNSPLEESTQNTGVPAQTSSEIPRDARQLRTDTAHAPHASRRRPAGTKPAHLLGRRSHGKFSILFRPWRKLVYWWNYWQFTRQLRRTFHRTFSQLHAAQQFKVQDYTQILDSGRVVRHSWPTRGNVYNPLWWFRWAWQFVVRWLATRPYLPMAFAAPGVLAGAGILALISVGGAVSDASHSAIYKRTLAGELSEMDLDQARLAMDALIQIDPSSPVLAFDRATIEARRGNSSETRQIMTELALTARFEPAALWLAGEVGDTQQLSAWSAEQVQDYYRWLQVAMQNAPDDPLPRRLVGDLKRITGDKQGAYDALLPIADVDVSTSYLVYFLQKELGHSELARARRERLERAYRSRLKDQPSDINSRVQYSFLLAAEDQYPEAIGLLDEGQVAASAPEAQAALRRAKCELMVLETRKEVQGGRTPKQTIERFALLKEAMAVDPTTPSLIDAITQACIEVADSKSNELVILRESLVQNVDSDTSHFILGTLALQQGEMETATQHLELAALNSPKLPGLLNNLAHAISHSASPDLPRALRIVNAGLASLPDHPFLRETRGQIYLQLKQYTEAIADLEVAMNAPELRAQAREGLAQAYEASGQPEIAARQRDLAKKGR